MDRVVSHRLVTSPLDAAACSGRRTAWGGYSRSNPDSDRSWDEDDCDDRAIPWPAGTQNLPPSHRAPNIRQNFQHRPARSEFAMRSRTPIPVRRTVVRNASFLFLLLSAQATAQQREFTAADYDRGARWLA